MKHWIEKIKSIFQLNETLTVETRREITLRYMIWITFALILVLAVVRMQIWLQDRTPLTTFYFVNSICGLLLLGFISRLNDIGHSRTAGSVFLIGATYLCIFAYPIRNPDQILLYFALPTVVSSFISDERSSIWYGLICSVGYTIYHLAASPGQPFPIFSVGILMMFALVSWQVASIIRKITLQLVAAYDSTIEGWSQALEMRNQETEGHSHRVTDLALLLAKKLRQDETALVHIRRGALLHDIGKMGIPDSILCKPGPLSTQENTVMRKHPEFARDLLCRIPYLLPAIDIPYNHHEKWDGTGYPRGLHGEEIPFASRIFTVVDVWDAMRSKRSYRPAIPDQQVLEYLNTESGRSFDPRVVKAFFELLDVTPPAAGKTVPMLYHKKVEQSKTI